MSNEERVIALIKEKKSLAGVSSQLIKSELEAYLKDNKIKLYDLSKKDEKVIVKDLRQRLRRLTGSFHREKINQEPLDSHSSTKERLEFYATLREKISELNPSSILDLGCGVNPLALATQGVRYYAYDINEIDLSLVSSFFKEKGIQGETVIADLRKKDLNFPNADLCLMLKILDILDHKNHKLSEHLLNKIKAKHFIISFPTKTLSGRPMRHPQRGWIERLLKRLNFTYEIFSSKNEIFYLAHR